MAQQPAHDLAGPGLGHVVGPDDPLGPGELADPLGHVLTQRILEHGLGGHAGAQRDVGHDRLAGELVTDRDDRGFGHRRGRDKRRLDLGGGQPVARDVDDVVDPPGDPEVAVLVPAGAVAHEVDTRAEPGEVGRYEPVGIGVEGAEHAGPRLGQHQYAAALFDLAARVVEQGRGHSGQRTGDRAWLSGRQAGQRRDHDATGLGLPPGVDNRAALGADDRVVPQPGLGVDRLADGAEQSQAGQVMLGGGLGAPLHAGADRGGGGVEDGDAVPLDDVPPDVLVRIVGRAFEHHRRAAVGHRAVYDIRVAGDPADVGGAPEDVTLRVQVEHHGGGAGDTGQVPAGGVHYALRLGRGAG